MIRHVLIVVSFVSFGLPALAETISPIFGSSTQDPVIIVINPETGQPTASADVTVPVVASVQ
jgi:hypothetical protein